LLALSVEVGLGVLLEQEVDELVGPERKWNRERTAVRHGREDGEVTLGGRRVQVRRPLVRTADGESEVPLSTVARRPATGVSTNGRRLPWTISGTLVLAAGGVDVSTDEDREDGQQWARGCASLARVSETVGSAPDHGVIDGASSVPPPLVATGPAPRLSAAEEARTLVAATHVAALATLTADGDPWASLITYGALDDGAAVLCLSRLAEHGRNLAADPRASLVITQIDRPPDPLAAARVTLAGRAERPSDAASLAAARAAHLAAVPAASSYIDFSDFSLWILHIDRVRWVGGYGRMDSASGPAYAAAQPDPVATGASAAIAHLNADHTDALLAIAQALGGYPDATVARCSGLDRRGIDLALDTPRGRAPARVSFSATLTESAQLRAATVELAQRARAAANAP
jgi:putative heme iron utilization protein